MKEFERKRQRCRERVRKNSGKKRRKKRGGSEEKVTRPQKARNVGKLKDIVDFFFSFSGATVL